MSEPPPAPGGLRIDLDELLSLPPPPPIERSCAEFEMELDFDDSLTRVRAPAVREGAELSSDTPSIQPVAMAAEENEAPRIHERRPRAGRTMLAFGAVVALSGGLAIGLKPAKAPPDGIREGFAPAGALLRSLEPLASASTSMSPAAEPAEPSTIATPAPAASEPATDKNVKHRKRAIASAPEASAQTRGTSPNPEAPVATSTAEPLAAGAFDPARARAAIAGPSAAATGCFDAASTEVARVTITFQPDGHSTRATIAGGPYAGTAVGSCIAATFRGLSVPAFDGPAVTVATSVHPPARTARVD